MPEIRLVSLDRTRPALVLTRETARGAMTKVTVAPVTTTINGLSSEVRLGLDNGLDHECAVALDNVVTVPEHLLGQQVGYLKAEQEAELARAVVPAYDFEVPLLECHARHSRRQSRTSLRRLGDGGTRRTGGWAARLTPHARSWPRNVVQRVNRRPLGACAASAPEQPAPGWPSTGTGRSEER